MSEIGGMSLQSLMTSLVICLFLSFPLCKEFFTGDKL